MSETTISTTPAVDEKARFRAFTAMGLALTALAGGGVFATAAQWIAMRARSFNGNGSDQFFWIAISVGPMAMCLVALWLASTCLTSQDALVRPLARATRVLCGVGVVGSALLMLATFGQP